MEYITTYKVVIANSFQLIGLLAYNEAFSTPPYTGIGLETYFYCNYNDVCE
jgi:hypothetical protein